MWLLNSSIMIKFILHKLSTAIFRVNGKDGGFILYFLSSTQHLGQLRYFSTVDLLNLIISFIAICNTFEKLEDTP